MFPIFLFLFTAGVVSGYFTIEEESLIILAGLFWVDAAGGNMRNVISEEFVQKGFLIKKNFVWFLETKMKDIKGNKKIYYKKIVLFFLKKFKYSKEIEELLYLLIRVIVRKKLYLYRILSVILTRRVLVKNRDFFIEKNKKAFFYLFDKSRNVFIVKKSSIIQILDNDFQTKNTLATY